MKKYFLLALLMTCTLSVLADDYPYLTFENSDGTKTSVSSASLTITIADGKLKVGSQSFELSDLSKMYFSATDVTNGIEELLISLDNTAEIYDLQGRKVTRDQMRRGVYVIKTNSGTRKVTVK